MVDYKVFYVLWTSAVLAQCLMNEADETSNVVGLLQSKSDLFFRIGLISLTAGFFHNWLWRCLVFGIVWGLGILSPELPVSYLGAFTLWYMIFTSPTLRHLPFLRPKMKHSVNGEQAVFVTGCDSGMGYATCVRLAKLGYHVYAGCFSAKTSKEKIYAEITDEIVRKRITIIDVDVTSDEKVTNAVSTVEQTMKELKENNNKEQKMIGIINCAGLGYNGPGEYFPMELYEKQLQVNFLGYVRVVQAFMPLVKAGCSTSRRGRIVFIGTGGGTLTPIPPLLSAYMASKFAVEAFCGSMRFEMQLTNQPIDCVMLNPGFVKPTMLASVGLQLTNNMWDMCFKRYGDHRAKDAYGDLLNIFIDYTAKEKGTHVSKVAEVMEQILEENRPNACYKVGEDSKASAVVSLLPTCVKEFMVKASVYKQVGST